MPAFCCYKSRQGLLQIVATDLLQIVANVITYRGSYYKSWQVYYKSWQILQIVAIITKRGRTHKHITPVLGVSCQHGCYVSIKTEYKLAISFMFMQNIYVIFRKVSPTVQQILMYFFTRYSNWLIPFLILKLFSRRMHLYTKLHTLYIH